MLKSVLKSLTANLLSCKKVDPSALNSVLHIFSFLFSFIVAFGVVVGGWERRQKNLSSDVAEIRKSQISFQTAPFAFSGRWLINIKEFIFRSIANCLRSSANSANRARRKRVSDDLKVKIFLLLRRSLLIIFQSFLMLFLEAAQLQPRWRDCSAILASVAGFTLITIRQLCGAKLSSLSSSFVWCWKDSTPTTPSTSAQRGSLEFKSSLFATLKLLVVAKSLK